ncbi:MAG: ribosomal protein S18-alanine N-acetyltransferase [Desulfobulbus sp.]|nr:ribosomal protein S18-alanine N-acetyltransferase [Desulfobulbus sp.]
MRIRRVRPGDLDEVLDIEHRSMPDPWQAAAVAGELQVANSVGWVALAAGRVQGYAFFRTCRPECELLRLAIEPESRRGGLGSALLDEALGSLTKEGYTCCYLEVRRSNEGAYRLYERSGFRQTGLRKNYYSQPVEDAAQLCRALNGNKGGML